MELFRKDGHLSDEGLQGIIDGSLDEMQSLEAAEHLSFCDKCLLQYTNLLEGVELLEPLVPMKEPVLQRIKQKGKKILFSKYIKIGAAACLAVTLWSVGAFTGVAAQFDRKTEKPAPPAHTAEHRLEVGGILDNAMSSINSFLNGIVTPQPKDEREAMREDTLSTSGKEDKQLPPESTSTQEK